MPTVAKRAAVWIIEILVEALLLGCLLGVLVSSEIGLSYGVLGSVLALPVVLFLHGYYFTRLLAGVVWRSRGQWTYPAVAATLFVIHTHIVFVRLGPDMSTFGKAKELPFLLGGACIVFACALAGNWGLRKWTQSGGSTSASLGYTQ
jgi:hypothetical protein